MYRFTTPSVWYPLGEGPLLGRYHYDSGVSVLKNLDGTYSLQETPTEEDLAAASTSYLGGHVYLVSDSEAAALSAAGFGAGLVQL